MDVVHLDDDIEEVDGVCFGTWNDTRVINVLVNTVLTTYF